MTLYLLHNICRVECKNASFITGKFIEAEAVTYFKILQRGLSEVSKKITKFRDSWYLCREFKRDHLKTCTKHSTVS